jgi:DNA-binding CsgD family transcriptional regulator
VVVDDVHWVDAPSLRYLAFLLTRLEELDVALVVATRPREPGTNAELLATVTASPSAEVIRLPPLTGEAVGELVEVAVGQAADPEFVEACLRATRGTPFLVRELVGALREGGIAPTAESACHVERIGARSVGRSINLRLRRLPEHAGRLARALAVLEQGDLVLAGRLAQLDEAEAADAADLLARAGIFEPGLPVTFVHPIVRSGIYLELSGVERANAHRRAARLLAEQPGANERVAQHLLVTEPAADRWVVGQLAQAARAARGRGAPEAEAVLLCRALAEPPTPGDQYGVLLNLGMAEASVGLANWPEHLRRAVDTAPDARSVGDAAMVLGYALSRAQRFAEAVEVLDSASASLDPRHCELSHVVAASALFPRLNDPATAPSVTLRLAELREWAAGHQTAPPEPLAAFAFCSVLRNEPAEIGADFAARALAAGASATAATRDRPWYSYSSWFSMATFPLVWGERYAQARPLLDTSVARARATGDSSRLTMGLATRGWLALREGDLGAAEDDTRTALAATALPAPPMYRVLNSAVLIQTLVDQGEFDAAEEALAPFDLEAAKGTLVSAILRFARGRLRTEQGRVAEAVDDFSAVGLFLTRVQVTSPSFVPWRSEAALARLALGEQEEARRLAEEELELARAFGTPRALGVAKRAAGLAAGGEQGELLLREAIEAFEHADVMLERARTLVDLGAMLRRRNRRPQARELLRDALDTAHRSGARRLAERAETELRATGARPRRVVLTGLDSLTASERRIAELASRALTNREIAQTLFITDRTVEGHLTSIFRKLQLDSRTGLPAALSEDAPVSA